MFEIKKYSDIINKFNCAVIGDISKINFSTIKHFLDSQSNALVFVEKDYVSKIDIEKKIIANTVITNLTEAEVINYFISDVIILTDRPRHLISLFSEVLFSQNNSKTQGIHQSAVIHPEAIIHESAYIGPNTYIGKSKIGAFTRIEGTCHIQDDVFIGNYCRIHPGVVIGVEGSGHVYDNEFGWIKFPQIGKTIIEDYVEIGANSYITKGALTNTHLKSGCIIGLDCGIGHNVTIEENAIILAKALIGGSSVVKQNASVGIMATIRDGLIVGKNSRVGMGAVVTKDIPDNQVWMGNPAKFYQKQVSQ